MIKKGKYVQQSTGIIRIVTRVKFNGGAGMVFFTQDNRQFQCKFSEFEEWLDGKEVDRVMNYTEQLKIASTRINSSSDLLTEEITALETTINSLNLGVSLFIEIEPLDLYLGYAKVNNSWGFAVKQDIDEVPQKVRDAGREIRISLTPFFPKLIEEMILETHATAAAIELSTKKLSALRESLQ